MRITNLHIARFGVWRDLRLDFPDAGVNVIYGPNEAGKSTLLRFIRGMFFGFQVTAPGERDFDRADSEVSGRMTLRNSAGEWQIRRSSSAGGSSELTVVAPDGRKGGAAELQLLLGDVTQTLFEHVFAVGLREIQELATLHDADVAQHIYGLTLGHGGQALVSALERQQAARLEIWDPANKIGELLSLLERRAALDRELARQDAQRTRYVALCREVDRLDAVAAELKTRQTGLQSQLRGHQFLARVWEPWQRVDALRGELRKLDYVEDFPEDGLSRLARHEADLEQATAERGSLLASADDFEAQAAALEIDTELRRRMSVMRGLVDQSEWIEELRDRQRLLGEEADGAREELQLALEALGTPWSLERLEAADTSAGRHLQLVTAAREYQAALKYRRRRRRRYQQLAADEKQREAIFAEAKQVLDAADIPQAIARTQSDVARLADLAEFQVERQTLEQRNQSLHEQIARLKERIGLPRWLVVAIWAFVVCGAALAGLGLHTGLTINWLAGLVYVFTGGFAGTLLWAVTWSYQRSLRERMEALGERRVENDGQLRQTIRNIDLLERELPGYLRKNADDVLPKQITNDAGAGAEQSRTRSAMQRLAELERLAETETQIRQHRRRLSQLRGKFRDVQRTVMTARQTWCQLLQQAGFAETVRVDEAFTVWQQVVEAGALARRWRALEDEAQNADRAVEPYEQEIQAACELLGEGDTKHGDLEDLLPLWSDRLRELDARSNEQVRLQREAERCRREADELLGPLHESRTALGALLVRTGAADADEFRLFAEEWSRREELLAELETAEFELQTAARTEPELAIAEEDLRAFNVQHNAHCIETLEQEFHDLEADMRGTYERLGRCKQELAALEADERPLHTLSERQHVEEELRQAVKRWHAVQLAGRALFAMRDDYEQTSQPAVLQAASEHLARMSRGRYARVWAPLGERRLLLDNERGETLPVERLSRGAREQLFLAVRLATTDALAGQGLMLPLILDDVLVNLDQSRTEAAVDELATVTTHRRQVFFFTCHQHVARMFETHGSDPVPLPAHREYQEERRAG